LIDEKSSHKSGAPEDFKQALRDSDCYTICPISRRLRFFQRGGVHI